MFNAEFYKHILDKINSQVYITDVETDTIVYANDIFRQSFGLEDPVEKPAGKNFKKE